MGTISKQYRQLQATALQDSHSESPLVSCKLGGVYNGTRGPVRCTAALAAVSAARRPGHFAPGCCQGTHLPPATSSPPLPPPSGPIPPCIHPSLLCPSTLAPSPLVLLLSFTRYLLFVQCYRYRMPALHHTTHSPTSRLWTPLARSPPCPSTTTLPPRPLPRASLVTCFVTCYC